MDELVRQRGRLKAKLTRICSFADRLASAPSSSTDIKIRLEMLETIWTDFDSTQTKIECACQEDELDTQQIEQEDFESRFCTTKAKLLQVYEQLSEIPVVAPLQLPTGITGVSPGQPPHIKLPTIDLPTFSGNYQQWTEFSDLFTSVIHTNSSLTPVQKLHYLKSSMRGDASRLLGSIAVTTANYDEAWRILVDRYSNRRQIVQSHLRSLCSQAELTGESPTDLRKLLDVTVENVRALHALGLPTQQWECILMFLVTEKLDINTRRQWELSLTDNVDASFEQLKEFIEKRCRALEVTGHEVKRPFMPVKSKDVQRGKQRSNTVSCHAVSMSCVVCKAKHSLFRCEQFLKMAVERRIQVVKASSLCFNCLKTGHRVGECKSSTCRRCQQRHNTLLHRETEPRLAETNASGPIISHHLSNAKNTQVLLATAVINLRDHLGNYRRIRALLDSGSQATFITHSCCQHFGLKQQDVDIVVNGLGAVGLGKCRGMVQLQLSSIHTSYVCDVKALVMHTVTGDLPLHPVDPRALSSLVEKHNLSLADPNYYQPGSIDLLLGADIYYDLLLSGKFRDADSAVIFQNTNLGWIVSGPIMDHGCQSQVTSHIGMVELSQQLRSFWELEEIKLPVQYTAEELECEQHFKDTYSRTKEGRFVVHLPFKHSVVELGDTKVMARQRLLHIERKLETRPDCKRDYGEFMNEYLSLGHMEIVREKDDTGTSYHLPHHYVIKESSTTTRLRVVFDGTARPARGLSLNEALMVGPTIQCELFDIVMRFRMYSIVFTADIAKMYRQFLVHDEHRNYQRILWRTAPTEPITEYRLRTLTYGTAPASFLAIRCLIELATINESTHPLAAAIIRRDFYVDDLISGAGSIEEAVLAQTQLIEVLASGCLELRKWNSNSDELLQTLPEDLRNHNTSMEFGCDDTIKTLGIHWHPTSDAFLFKIMPNVGSDVSKRKILSQISKLFDPLGWLAPIIVHAKIVIQRLWLLGVGWDDELPVDVVNSWRQYVRELPVIESIRVHRKMVGDCIEGSYQVHGFCDASELAYGAVVFIRSASKGGVVTELVCSKSRVAPLKKVSLPRLELCGALMLARLLSRVTAILSIQLDKVHAWTDSTVVLAWLNRHPHSWKTFVANRVTEIHEMLPPEHWRHVRSNDNPADCLSRGMLPSQIIGFQLWWNGPDWLLLEECEWPVNTKPEVASDIMVLEQRKTALLTCIATRDVSEMLEKYSSLTRLVRITACCFRFANNCRSEKNDRVVGHLSVRELQSGLMCWIRHAQESNFGQELQRCKKGKPLAPGSRLLPLSPFIDSEGILRVGGRLQEADLQYGQKHPIILPQSHVLTKLIVRHGHINNLHAGPQLLAAVLRNEYWILRARQIIRQIIHQCVKCFRHRVSTSQQLMGSLPKGRVECARAFVRCGVDYTGPVMIRPRGRGNLKKVKAYICIFVCFATKAIHIELASDLTTESFIAAFRRFIARRGKPTDMYSDCGTNFIGAERDLRELGSKISSADYNQQIAHITANQGINWHFNPPSSPHFGGLWEAGVKSIKYHLRRTVGSSILTYEETTTVLAQIEACLNSRPLCPLSADSDDLDALTPGHFLIGQALNTVPDQNLLQCASNRLTRWQLVQKIYQHFWQRWSGEYLARLQQRPKWVTRVPNIKIGDLVLLKENNIAPLNWPMARVLEVHPGADGLVRVITIKCRGGAYKRPVSKCCLLPIQHESI